jgi:hypothetical protein
MSRQDQPAFDAVLWFQWIVATTLGWLLGDLLLPNLSAISAGVGVGLMQWAILYRRIPRAWRWPLSTAIAWLGGAIILQVAVPADLQILLSGAILGPLVGLAQWLILRREVYWAGWWLVVSTMAWITGLTLLPGILATGAMVGALSGIALSLLLHTPRPAEEQDQTKHKGNSQ